MSHDYKTLLTQLTDSQILTASQMQTMMNGILSGEWTPAQTAAALIALKMRGETPAEIAAAAAVMREFCTPVNISTENTIDTCGTGGDGGNTFNISTTAAFVTAACNVRVAKHGNRAMSGASGSSDILDALGLPLTLTPAQNAALINDTGITFMFAPAHHPAMKHAAGVRRELGVRTLFNLLGPLCNPAGVSRQVIGVFSADLLMPYAETLLALGSTHAIVAHGAGLDEISISDDTMLAEIKNGMIERHTISPEAVGLKRAPLADIQVSSVEESKQTLLSVLAGDKTAARDIVLLNAAAALIVAGVADDFTAGIAQAAQAIDSGAAKQKLQQFIAAAQQLAA